MRAASAKNKGRRLQQWMRDLIIQKCNLHAEDCKSCSMGAGGEDVTLSHAARCKFPYSIECKNVEKVNVWAAMAQCSKNAGRNTPLVILKRNSSRPLAVVDAEHFVALVARNNAQTIDPDLLCRPASAPEPEEKSDDSQFSFEEVQRAQTP